jgi:ubiquinone/menaquinone biosynthesis C-methylase UbiE
MADGYPDLEQLGVAVHAGRHLEQPLCTPGFMRCMGKLIDLNNGERTVAVVGCGPKPRAVKWLVENGYDAVGVDPVPGVVESAAEFLGAEYVRLGTAEQLPFKDGSRRMILMESVLEHVDSPQKALSECWRVLKPGGVLFVYTTNRWRFNLSGRNGEYQVRFFNWFPDVVKESYVFQQLHYDPKLARYNARPAVHWFSYSSLCKLGREVGFAQFYSLLDLADAANPLISKSRFRSFLLNKIRFNPWLRGLALSQAGGSSIFMWKRR